MILMLLMACNSIFGVANRVADPDNIIHGQEWFHQANENISARVSQIESSKTLSEGVTDPAELQRLRIELAGQQQSCRQLVADYNANGEKVTMGLFKGWSLPQSIDNSVCN